MTSALLEGGGGGGVQATSPPFQKKIHHADLHWLVVTTNKLCLIIYTSESEWLRRSAQVTGVIRRGEMGGGGGGGGGALR